MKEGYSFLFYNRFKWNDYHTWLAPFIRFFGMVYCLFTRKQYTKYSHCGIFAGYENELWVYEASDKGFIRSERAIDYVKNRGLQNFIILKPKFPLYLGKLRAECERLDMLNLEYDYLGLLVEATYLSTSGRLWLGNDEIGGKVFCTEVVACIYNEITEYRIFDTPCRMHPIAFFNSPLFKKYIFDKDFNLILR